MQEYAEIESSGLKLRGMIHIPDQDKNNYPFVVMYHGFTGNRLEAQGNFIRLSRELENIGIGSARFDFGGSGESDGNFEDMTLTCEINDAVNIYKFILDKNYSDKNNIFVLGMSMGGLIAGLIAERLRNLKSMVLWAPAGNMIDISRQQGINTRSGKYEINGMLLKKEFVSDLEKYDPYCNASGFKGNVLIIHGTQDIDVPVSVSIKYKNSFAGRCKLIKIPGADHIFSRMIWKERLLKLTEEFLRSEIKRGT